MFLPLEESIIISREDEEIILYRWKYQIFNSADKDYQASVIIPLPRIPSLVYPLKYGIFGSLNFMTALLKEQEDNESEYNGESIFQKISKEAQTIDIEDLDFVPLKLSRMEIINGSKLQETSHWFDINGYTLSDLQKNHINFYLQKNWQFVLCSFSIDEKIKKDSYITLEPILISIKKDRKDSDVIYPLPVTVFSNMQNICSNIYVLSPKGMKPENDNDFKLLYANKVNSSVPGLANFFKPDVDLDLTKFENQRNITQTIAPIKFIPYNIEKYSIPDLIINSEEFNEWLEEKHSSLMENVRKDDEFLYIIEEFCLRKGRLPKVFEFKKLLTNYYSASFSIYNPFSQKIWQNDGSPGDLQYTINDDTFSIKFYDFWGNVVHEINGVYERETLIKKFLGALERLNNLDTEKILFLLTCKYFSEYPLKTLGNDSLPTMAYIEPFFTETINNLLKNKFLGSLSRPAESLWDALCDEMKDEIELKYSEYVGENYINFKDPILSVALEECINLGKFREMSIKIFTSMGEPTAPLEKTFLTLLGTLLVENSLKDMSGKYSLLNEWISNRGIIIGNNDNLNNYSVLFYLYLLWTKYHFNSDEDGVKKSFEKAAILFINDNWDIIPSSLQDSLMEYIQETPSSSIVYGILHNYDHITPEFQRLPYLWLSTPEFKYHKDVYADIANNYSKRPAKLTDLLYNLFKGENHYLQRQVSAMIGDIYKDLPPFLEQSVLYAQKQYDAVDDILESAWVYYKMDRLNEAVNEYKKIAAIDPDDADMHYGLGLVYAQLRQHENAITEFNNTLKIDPTFSSAYNNLGTIYKRLTTFDKAKENYQKAIVFNPKKAVYYFNLGTVYHAVSHKTKDETEKNILFDSAIDAFAKAIHLDEQLSIAHFHLGNVFYEKKLFDDAKSEYQDAIKSDPHNAELYFRLAKVYHAKGEHNKAVEIYKKVLAIDPNHIGSLIQLALEYQNQGNIQEAVKKFENILEINPKYLDAYSHLVNVYINTGELDKAENLCLKAISIDPQYINIYNQLGIIYYKKKAYDKALETYTKALEAKPGDIHILNNMALIYDDTNQKKKALDLYKKVLETDPGNSTVYNNMGFIYFDLDDFDNGITVFKRSIELGKNNYDAYAGLGIVYYIKGNKQEGIDCFQHAIQINGNCSSLDFLKGDLFWNDKASGEAAKILSDIYSTQE